ncbi:hypothetical protein FRC10_003558 [Ceratobasidium sp. 414]|nr:hypothetical protein FRC10_003558 [Ceratobasidium sp. 414]
MSHPRVTFIVTPDDMAEIGQRCEIRASYGALARRTARSIIECLPPVGWVRLYDASIDGNICYAFMVGARNTPPDQVSSVLIDQLGGLFKQVPQQFLQGEEHWIWYNGSRKLIIGDIILTRRRDVVTEYE